MFVWTGRACWLMASLRGGTSLGAWSWVWSPFRVAGGKMETPEMPCWWWLWWYMNEWRREGRKERTNELISFPINQMHEGTKERWCQFILLWNQRNQEQKEYDGKYQEEEPEGGQNQDGGQGPWRKMILRVENRSTRRSEERGEPKAESWEGEEGKGRNQSAF